MAGPPGVDVRPTLSGLPDADLHGFDQFWFLQAIFAGPPKGRRATTAPGASGRPSRVAFVGSPEGGLRPGRGRSGRGGPAGAGCSRRRGGWR